MISIQDGAKQIYSDNPNSVYFLTGPEYGVKLQYIQVLALKFNNQIEEYPSLSQLIDNLSTKSLIPRVPKVYIVRYDKEFVAKPNLNILKLKVPGVIVGLYQDDSDEAKLDKNFPNNVLRINYLTPQIAFKHLCNEFQDIPEILIKDAIEIGSDFYSSRLICLAMRHIPNSELHNISKVQLQSLFGHQSTYDTQKFKISIASRNFKLAIKEIEFYEGDKSLLIYDILSTFLEIAKVLEKSYSDSFVKPYVNSWNHNSLQMMYDITYEQLDLLRNYSNYSAYDSLVYICSLLQFKLG